MDEPQNCECRDDACCPDDRSVDRRTFVKLAALTAASASAAGMPAMAGPFDDVNEYLRAIPSDKKLRPEWVRSLYDRGEKEVYTEPAALRHIGMPVGGFFAGTVYLSGDGRLWLWDIFNEDSLGIAPRASDKMPRTFTGNHLNGGLNYIEPAPFRQPFQQGFTLRVSDETRRLDSEGFEKVTFDGRYPIGRVEYRDDDCPVEVTLEAFSPFIPLQLDDSSLPATVMSYTIRNTSLQTIECEIAGHMQNAVALDTSKTLHGRRVNRIVRDEGITALECSAAQVDSKPATRPDIVFEDFEKPHYGDWTVEGEAFGDGPVLLSEVPDYQGDLAGNGKRVANSHASAPGEDVGAKDAQTGTLTSKAFTIERQFIHLLVGGGAHRGETCVNLLIEGKAVASVTGKSDNRMSAAAFNVAAQQGKQAQIQIVDVKHGPWSNIGADHIVFSDRPPTTGDLEQQRDFGTMTLTLMGRANNVLASATRDGDSQRADGLLTDELVGRIGRTLSLGPGESETIAFAVTWHFPNFYARGVGGSNVGHHYASRFGSALDVARYLAANFSRLAGDTRKWVDTWYDSSLPYWLLDRTMANTSILATTTCFRFFDGRFWAWEGIGCCAGTCTHVWHYAQAPGRLFPELERIERERVNFGIGLHDDGGVGMRTNLRGSNHAADDGQAGRILGVLREHQMSSDDRFLHRLWPKVKMAIEYLIRKDVDQDGVIEGSQPNTLDAAWFGKISFISSLYLAALKAGQQMAIEMGDDPFAEKCRQIAQRGETSILETYNGEYFVQIEDPRHENEIGVGPGCYIDQIFGQTWAHWTNLGRLFDREKQLSALRALWKYNFVPDCGPFREKFKQGRWYAAAGDAGLIMCSWPKGGQNPNFHKHWQYMYFNECMTGFEWQAAAHMIWEGYDQPDLLQAGLAVSRAIHDRYNAALRNPYNEIECSDHYSRAMASYGVFQSVCGFQCHGPKGMIEFAPRLKPAEFKAAFIAAEGWGTVEQQRIGAAQKNRITLKHGQIPIETLNVDVPEDRTIKSAEVLLDGNRVQTAFAQDGNRVRITLIESLQLPAGQTLEIEIA
jgi:non-lysosomal glucosylceramidase